jgi:hypothetical protein
MRWLAAIVGLFFLMWAMLGTFSLRKTKTTRTDRSEIALDQDRVLPVRERIAWLVASIAVGSTGLLLIAGAAHRFDVRVLNVAPLRVLGVAVLVAALAFCAGVAGLRAWRIHTGDSAAWEGGDDDAEQIFFRLLMSSRVGASLLAIGSAALAVFTACQLGPAWKGKGGQLGLVFLAADPLHTLGSVLGLGALGIGVISALIWIIYSFATDKAERPASCLALVGLYILIGLVIAWPLGFSHWWFGILRGVLSNL